MIDMEETNYKKTGTTTIGIKCRDGIVLAADKRATAGHFIADKNVEKAIKNHIIEKAELIGRYSRK